MSKWQHSAICLRESRVSLLVLAEKLLIQWRESVSSIGDIPRFLEVYDIMGIFPSLFIAAVRNTMEVHPKTEKKKWKIILELCDFIRNLMKLTNKLLRQLHQIIFFKYETVQLWYKTIFAKNQDKPLFWVIDHDGNHRLPPGFGKSHHILSWCWMTHVTEKARC